MKEENAFALLVGFVALMFFGLLFAAGYADYRREIACMERSGTMVRSSCIFITSSDVRG